VLHGGGEHFEALLLQVAAHAHVSLMYSAVTFEISGHLNALKTMHPGVDYIE